MTKRLIVGLALLVLGCPAAELDGDDENAEDTGCTGDTEGTGETGETGETSETADEGGECLPEQPGVAPNFDVSLLGFPEVEDGMLVNPDEGLDFSGPCVLDDMDFADATVTLDLSCDHPAPSLPEGASVTIVTAATSIPAGIVEGDTLTFQARAFFSQGGVVVDPDISLLVLDANVEFYSLRDEEGLIFAANARSLDGDFEDVVVVGAHDCPTYEGCSDTGIIAGYIVATAGGQSIDVQIGEVGQLDGGSLSWDVSLFQARFDSNDCHFGERGSFSVVRRP